MRLAWLLVLALWGCGGDASDGTDNEKESGGHGMATGAVCPDGSRLTYTNFGRSFMALYCTRCHGSGVDGDAREGAPASMNFDSLIAIRGQAIEIDEHAAAGPMSMNREMPPSDPLPSDNERRMLGEWLSCGAP